MSTPQNDKRALRNTLGRFATGVTIVTAIDPDGHPMGLTVNSFSAVSLDPALVLWCLDNNSNNLAAFKKATHHAINILAADQQDLSNRFATWPADRFAGLDWQAGVGGAPVFPGCCATFELAITTAYEAGDHTIFIGRIENFEQAERDPLLFFAGQYRSIAALG
ncbi:MAG: flavin reductase [Proteobacteria bacterium]|nr:flavin reductase [Pseudomonadota bacterium]